MRKGGAWCVALVTAAGCGYPQPARLGDASGADTLPRDARATDASKMDAEIDAPPPFSRLMFYGSSLGNDTSERDTFLASHFSLTSKSDSIPITASLLATTDVVLIQYLSSSHTVSESTALASWINSGGTLIITSGWAPGTTDLPSYNALLAGLGVQLTTPKVSGPITQFFTHPISANMTSLPFNDGYNLTLPVGESTEVGRLSSKPALGAIQHGQGRAVAYGDDFFNFTPQWSGDVPTFWSQMIVWLGNQ